MPSTKQVPVPPRREQVDPEQVAPAPSAGGGEELIDGIDDLLDEIDSLLEEQAVLTNYRQRSGP
ncbi:MAG: Pup-like protein [Actinomycetota bacterium]|nr:Pup-like protein [Actinomycetota bacterium]